MGTRRIFAAMAGMALVTVAGLVAGCGADQPGEAARLPSAALSAVPSSAPSSAPSATAAPASAPTPAPTAAPAVPAGVNAGIAVYDRQAGAYLLRHQETLAFRSASLVKLLIALDYLWHRGPGYAVPAADRARLDVMLRSSDDAAATYLWNRAGKREIVSRMVNRLGLRGTAPPPAARPGYWGYTTLTADDVVLVYRYVLEGAPPPVRELVMGNLHSATRCGTDRFDQSFGIPSGYGKPWSAKQGWSGFGDAPAQPCVGDAMAREEPVYTDAGVLDGAVLHTTGTVGAGDRTIVVVLSQYPNGTSYANATAALTALTTSLPVPR